MRGHQRRRRDARTSHPGAARSVDGPPAEGAHRRIEGGHRRRCTPLASSPVSNMGFYQAWSHRYLGGAADLVATRAQGRGKREEGRRKDPVPSSLFLLPFSFVGGKYDLLARRGSLRRRCRDGAAYAGRTTAAWVRAVNCRVRAQLRDHLADPGLCPAGCAADAPGADEPWRGDYCRCGVWPSLGDPGPGGQRGCRAHGDPMVVSQYGRRTRTREQGNEGTRYYPGSALACHRERQRSDPLRKRDCFVASLLAMTPGGGW